MTAKASTIRHGEPESNRHGSAGRRAAGIKFDAAVYKVQTLIDGGLRVTLDLPETAIAEVAWLMECKRSEAPLKINAKKEERKSRERIS